MDRFGDQRVLWKENDGMGSVYLLIARNARLARIVSTVEMRDCLAQQLMCSLITDSRGGAEAYERQKRLTCRRPCPFAASGKASPDGNRLCGLLCDETISATKHPSQRSGTSSSDVFVFLRTRLML